jgi:hypothetical protein
MKTPEMRVNCTPVEPTREEFDACQEKHGDIAYEYDSQGCSQAWSCNTCQYTYNQANEKYRFWQFIIAATFALVAIIIGLYLPAEKNILHEAIGNGLLLGGLVTLFIGTGLSFSTFYKWLRPIIILGELILVIFIAYRKLKAKKTEDRLHVH